MSRLLWSGSFYVAVRTQTRATWSRNATYVGTAAAPRWYPIPASAANPHSSGGLDGPGNVLNLRLPMTKAKEYGWVQANGEPWLHPTWTDRPLYCHPAYYGATSMDPYSGGAFRQKDACVIRSGGGGNGNNINGAWLFRANQDTPAWEEFVEPGRAFRLALRQFMDVYSPVYTPDGELSGRADDHGPPCVLHATDVRSDHFAAPLSKTWWNANYTNWDVNEPNCGHTYLQQLFIDKTDELFKFGTSRMPQTDAGVWGKVWKAKYAVRDWEYVNAPLAGSVANFDYTTSDDEGVFGGQPWRTKHPTTEDVYYPSASLGFTSLWRRDPVTNVDTKVCDLPNTHIWKTGLAAVDGVNNRLLWYGSQNTIPIGQIDGVTDVPFVEIDLNTGTVVTPVAPTGAASSAVTNTVGIPNYNLGGTCLVWVPPWNAYAFYRCDQQTLYKVARQSAGLYSVTVHAVLDANSPGVINGWLKPPARAKDYGIWNRMWYSNELGGLLLNPSVFEPIWYVICED